MRKCLPFFSLFSGALLLTSTLTAQQADRFAYAVTDIQQGGANWSFLRKINLQNGEYSQVLLSGNDATLLAYDATTRKQFEAPLQDSRFGNYVNAAFATGVAAMAYDKKNNRLYYTPMFIDQLRYIDLKTMKVYYVTDQAFTGKPVKSSDQGNIVTRMVIASDGYGYAMTNDATQLIRFTVGKKLSITDLGTIADDQANKGVSIHNSCSSYGGDIIADDAGNLYVFSARNQVFKINLETKVATHLGTISGLPNGFTVNGAAVTNDNKVLVSSAMLASSYFTVDMKSLSATPYTIAGTVWQSSDLANGNLLNTGTQAKGNTVELISRNTEPNSGDGKISIFPNPVTNNQFAIQFNELEAGQYTIQVTDVMGRQVLQQIVSVAGEKQIQTVRLNASSSKGVYLVKVTDHANRSVYNTKIVVQ
ncbi:MAG TPA: T9SS type A sorting domain-containing protein [Chitinophagaceae bacterium]|nr:T9SS type A sorting domain-containing protein [Chitinophagaceae bacterium]HRF18656.1 T9SS type A sorting domain-containing protein [Chitinophagaceae bacterium]